MDPRRLKIAMWIGAIGTLLLLGLLAATAFVLPAYVESRLIPRLTSQFGLTARQVHVRRIGWGGADFGPIQYAAGEVPVVTVAAIHVDYSPLSLSRGRILGVALGGVRLVLTVGEQGITIPGLSLPEGEAAKQDAPAFPDMRTLLPIRLDRLNIRQAEVVATWNQRRFSIPFSMTLDGRDLQNGVLKADAEITILGNPLNLTVQLDQAANQAQWETYGSKLMLESLAQTGLLPTGLTMAGAADLRAKGRFKLQPFEASVSISADILDAIISTPQATIANGDTVPGRLPIALTIEADNKTGIRWDIAPLRIVAPVAAMIEKLEGQWQPNDDGWTLKAAMTSRLAPQDLSPGITLPHALSMQWIAEAGRHAKDPLVFKIGAVTDQPLELKNDLVRITQTGSRMDFSGRYIDGALTADATAGAEGIRLQLEQGRMEIAKPTVNGHVVLNPAAADAGSEFNATVTMANLRSSFGTSRVRFPKFDINATGQSPSGGPWRFRADIQAADGQATEKKSALALRGINVRLPVHWPLEARARTGRIHIGSMQWDKRQIGDLKGTLQQHDLGLDINLKHRSKLFPKLVVLVTGGMKNTGLLIDAQLPSYRLPTGIDLGQFMPSASGLAVTGLVAGKARLTWQIGLLETTAQFKLDQAGLLDAGRDIQLEGIQAEIALEDLLDIKSGPRQKLRVDRLRFGKLTADALAVDFQLERDKVLFIEKAGLDWSRGRINTAAIRIIPGQDDYEVTLFCDRLNLAMVLEQLGAAEASGEGSVNGRIPLRWTNGQISFDNGFLYSTPGQTGTIELSGTEVLLAGLPPGTPQHTQLDIASEALKDYTYKWAKLALTSEKENLLLKLKFDGKPNRLLPFAYDRSLGQFKRVKGEGQAEFKGISIDLNFTSPLNDIIHYKEFLKQN